MDAMTPVWAYVPRLLQKRCWPSCLWTTCCAIAPRIWMWLVPRRRLRLRHPVTTPRRSDCDLIVSKSNRRFYVRILLGVLAMGALVWVAADQFGISRDEIGALLLGVLLVVVSVIATAALLVGLWVGLRRLFGARKD